MTIKLLKDDLINKIAAGEVVERPASVVKELVENAADAGATRITVNIMRGGLDSIEVEDNGCGIAPDELQLAFQRHATSKISQEEDLSTIATMGFRGEALPSIASVSKIQIYSAQSDLGGINAQLEGGIITSAVPCSCLRGTRIIVSDIFYNTPARREFMKTPVTEGSNIHDIMNKLALSRPDISFKFSSQHKTYFKTPGMGNLHDTATALFGKDFSQDLVPVAYSSESYSISGLISVPEITRSNRKNQLFFINNRVVRSPMLYRAVDEAYRGLLISKEFPVVMLFINIPAYEVDVNVHPQKTEVRFRDEKRIFRLVVEVIREALGNLNYKFNLPTQAAAVSQYDRLANRSRFFEYSHGHLDFQSLPAEPAGVGYNHLSQPLNNDLSSYTEAGAVEHNNPPYRLLGQCFDSYILIEKEQEFVLIDQHAAHERINYEKLRSASQSDNSVQAMAFPVTVQPAIKSMEVLEQNLSVLEQLGFEIDIIGPAEIAIRTSPWAARGNEKEVMLEILDLLQEGTPVDLTDEAYKLMACKKSIKAGQVLTRPEMETIISDLYKLTEYKNCPHGRPVMLSISRKDLDHHFKRT